jgi:hypothetical protein
MHDWIATVVRRTSASVSAVLSSLRFGTAPHHSGHWR